VYPEDSETPVKVAVVGSRGFGALDLVTAYVNQLSMDDIVVSGGADGVDKTAEEAAIARGMKTIIFPAKWKEYGRSAGFRRNLHIVEEADRVVAFWDKKSKGTKHTIDIARKMGKPVMLVTIVEPLGE
jgi:predicted Rossmann fold nucleotide-binding protein DprA/Smf involved in DNA uptake